MLIDWFTVGAQALNFIILVWLLKRFLYKPIQGAIDTREKRIAAELADAAAKKAEAGKEHDEFEHKNAAFDQQRAALLSRATEAAEAERVRLVDEARKSAGDLETRRQETMRNQASSLDQAIRQRTQQEVFAIARKALTDLASGSLEQRMCEIFLDRLGKMDAKSKQGLAKALATSSGPALVRTAFDLPPAQREAIQKALNADFSAAIHLRFETAPDLVGGIELVSNGQKLAWSIADYLGSMEKGVGELLKATGKPQAKTVPNPAAPPEPKAAEPNAPESKVPEPKAPEPKAKATAEAKPDKATPELPGR
jgi:F-type H+-transporting ATPase subunit b